MEEELPNIFEYSDFRKYLSDYYDIRSSNDKTFTKSNMCRLLGLPNSRSYFSDVLNGKKVTPQKLQRFIEVLELAPMESTYFRTLVNFNQSDDDLDQKELYLDKLIHLNRTPEKLISKEVYLYYRQFHHSVIRATLDIVDFRDEYVKLSKILVPPTSAKTVKESIELLLELKLIAPNEEGYLKATDQLISTGSISMDSLIRQYQLSCLAVAKDIILKGKCTLPHRVITKTISMSEDAYRKLEKRVSDFNKEVNSLIHKDEKEADRVYQLDILLVPMSRNMES